MIAADDKGPGHAMAEVGLRSLGDSPNIELSLASFARPARAAPAEACVRTSKTAPVVPRLLFPSHLRLVRVWQMPGVRWRWQARVARWTHAA